VPVGGVAVGGVPVGGVAVGGVAVGGVAVGGEAAGRRVAVGRVDLLLGASSRTSPALLGAAEHRPRRGPALELRPRSVPLVLATSPADQGHTCGCGQPGEPHTKSTWFSASFGRAAGGRRTEGSRTADLICWRRSGSVLRVAPSRVLSLVRCASEV
jgi:hypothetical protein